MDPQGRVVEDSPTWREFTGQSVEQWRGDGWSEALHPDDIERVWKAWREAVKRKATFTIEYRLRRHDGEYRWTSVRAVPVVDDDGSVREWVGTNTDITASKIAENERTRLVSIVENSPEFIGIADPEGNPLFLNRSGRQLVGLPDPVDVRDTQVVDYFVPEERKLVEDVVLPAIIKHGRWAGELTFRNFTTGASIPVYSDLFRVDHPETGKPINIATVTRDITERKRAETLRAGQSHVLEMIATGKPLSDVLTAVARLIEEQEPGLLCSILLTDGERHTGIGFGPSLPPEFVHALHGIGYDPPHVGSCCRALDSGEQVLVADIENDGRWSPQWRELNLSYGLRACRSIPIHGSDGKVMASVAVFRRQPGDPGPSNKDLVGIATHLAGIAIERRRAEERERQLLMEMAMANAQFRAFFEQGALFAAIMQLDGTIIEPNRLSLEACGYTREQVVGKPFWECPWWNRSAELMQRIKDASARAAAGQTFRAELPCFVADGSQRVVDFILLPIKDKAGQVIFLAPTGTDITDRKRAETALKHSELRYRLVGQAANDAIWDWDLVTNQATWHEGVQRLFGYTPDQIGPDATWWYDTIHPDDRDRVIHGIHAAVDGDAEFWREEYRFRRSDGSYAEVLDRGRIVREAGKPHRMVGAMFDLTERKQAEEALREADRRKDEFLATLAHELRNPLAPLRNGLQILRLAGVNGQIAHDARTMMERQLGQMVHLIDDLLDVSRISRGKIELRKERVPLAKAVQQAVETSQPAIEQSGHNLAINLPSEPIYVDADVTRLAQVFSNLLHNAAKYTEHGGRISLSVQRHEEEVIVSVRDSGVGIPAHMLPQVFEMFTQVDRNLERSQGGLGIGLSIVKRLVEMHGGSVEVHSEGRGMGSEFVVRLPVVLSFESTWDSDGEAMGPGTRCRVLVVDDNRDAALSLALMLKLMGNETMTAHDGVEALDAGAKFRPDLILLDIGMPRLNGYDTAKQIRQEPWGRKIVLVALTGWGQEGDRRKSQDAGFDSHMVKPIDPAALEKLVGNLQSNKG